ncbi:hypothetical protein CCMA1212_001977 [Trichoderma ghanense]|uniref:F-box domain-containing protein n=1 Tax=Trichoderma ghanense TaxID=65468 RepID=A0ABY2HCZ7_9HYPO
MSSLSLGKAPIKFTWEGFPRDIRLLILNFLMEDDDDDCRLDCLAAVSREWQAEVERYKFARLRLTTSCIVGFGSMAPRWPLPVAYSLPRSCRSMI